MSRGAAPSQIADDDEPRREQEERGGRGHGNWRYSAGDDIELIDDEVGAVSLIATRTGWHAKRHKRYAGDVAQTDENG